MFSIDLSQKQYKTYILSDSIGQSQLEVVPERGGIVTRWCVQGQELLYLEKERFTHPELTVRGGIPILFPICGNLPDNTYSDQGKSYTLKQHGFARELPWQYLDQSTHDGASLSLQLESNDQTRLVYPFDFHVNFTYRIKGNSLEIFQRYTNLSKEAKMPFSTGLHPYFSAPDKTQLRFEIPSMQYKDQKDQRVYDFNGRFDPTLDEIDVIFSKLTGLAATVTDESRRLRLTVSYNSSYAYVVFWTVKGKDFYCVEPWTAPRNALNTGEHLIYLDPGASCEMVVQMGANFF